MKQPLNLCIGRKSTKDPSFEKQLKKEVLVCNNFIRNPKMKNDIPGNPNSIIALSFLEMTSSQLKKYFKS